MLQVRIAFWTNGIAEEGQIVTRHALDKGYVYVPANKAHGIKAGAWKKFVGLDALPSAIRDVLIANEIVLMDNKQPSKRAKGLRDAGK